MSATASQGTLFKAPNPDRIRNQGFLIKVFVKVRALTRNHKRRAFCSNAYLSEELGCSVATVTRALTRLEALGTIALEQVVGIKRYIRVRVSLEALKALLFPGHETHWRESAPEPKPARRRRTAKASSPTTTPIFDHPVEEPAAYPVEEGHNRVSLRDTCQTLPTEEGQQNTEGTTALGGDPVVVSSPEARGSLETDTPVQPEALRAIEALGVPPATAASIAKLAPMGKLLRRVQAVKEYLAKHEGNPGKLLRAAIRGDWEPSAPILPHASDQPGYTPPGRVIRDPDAPRPEPVLLPPARPSPSASAFDTLDDATRAELLDAALPRALAESKSKPELKSIEEKLTTSHFVKIMAAKMLEEGWRASRETQSTSDGLTSSLSEAAPAEATKPLPAAPQGERTQ